jgi:Senescence-associated protein
VRTDKGKEITENKYFIHAKHIGGGVLDLCTGIYAGLENAFTAVAQNTKETTESVLEYKYGADVKEVFSHTAEATWEVYQLKGIIKNQAVKSAGRTIKDELQGADNADKRIYESSFMPITTMSAQKPVPANNQQITGSFSMNMQK